MTSGDLNIDLSAKLTEIVFDEFLNAFSHFPIRFLGAGLDGGHLDAPSPADHESFGAPARRGLKFCL